MMNIHLVLSIVALSLLTGACSRFQTKEAAYLDSVRGRATQAEVRQALGAPQTVRHTEGGASLWVYERREQQAGNRFTAPGAWCEEYVISFDDKGILQGWKPRSHFHGGELMPTDCIPETEQAK